MDKIQMQKKNATATLVEKEAFLILNKIYPILNFFSIHFVSADGFRVLGLKIY